MERDDMDDFPSLLQLSVRTSHEFGVGTHCIVIPRASVRTASLGSLARGLIDGNDIAGHNLFLGHGVDHLGSHVIDGFHVGGFDGELALLVAL
jgi:hypothetical protein